MNTALTGSYMDAYNRRLDKGLSGSDVPHRLVVTLLYELPRFEPTVSRTRRWAAGRSACWRPRSPARPSPSSPPPTRPTRFRPDRCARTCCATPLARTAQTSRRWFDTSAFAAPAPFTFGNSPRSGLRGAPLVTTDATLEKIVPAHRALEVRSARRVLQSAEPRQFQRPRLHFRRRRFRRGLQRPPGPHRAAGRPAELLIKTGGATNPVAPPVSFSLLTVHPWN